MGSDGDLVTPAQWLDAMLQEDPDVSPLDDDAEQLHLTDDEGNENSPQKAPPASSSTAVNKVAFPPSATMLGEASLTFGAPSAPHLPLRPHLPLTGTASTSSPLSPLSSSRRALSEPTSLPPLGVTHVTNRNGSKHGVSSHASPGPSAPNPQLFLRVPIISGTAIPLSNTGPAPQSWPGLASGFSDGIGIPAGDSRIWMPKTAPKVVAQPNPAEVVVPSNVAVPPPDEVTAVIAADDVARGISAPTQDLGQLVAKSGPNLRPRNTVPNLYKEDAIATASASSQRKPRKRTSKNLAPVSTTPFDFKGKGPIQTPAGWVTPSVPPFVARPRPTSGKEPPKPPSFAAYRDAVADSLVDAWAIKTSRLPNIARYDPTRDLPPMVSTN